jgi:hypothetical protein
LMASARFCVSTSLVPTPRPKKVSATEGQAAATPGAGACEGAAATGCGHESCVGREKG